MTKEYSVATTNRFAAFEENSDSDDNVTISNKKVNVSICADGYIF